MKTVKLAIKDFATPIIRKGDLAKEGGIMASDLGIEQHTKIQSRLIKTENYEKEYALSESFISDKYKFTLRGRIDGLFTDDTPIIEEIKCSFSIKRLKAKIEEDDEHPYKLQTLTYAHIYYLKTGILAKTRIRLVSLRDSKEELVNIDYSPTIFSKWMKKKLRRLVKIEKDYEKRIIRRKKMATKITFPFPNKRPLQSELMDVVENSSNKASQLMIQAPTGIGKTLGVMFPSLKNSLKRGASLIYLTPKNSQFHVAEDAAKRLQESGLGLKVVVLTAKSKICQKDDTICTPEYCEYAKSYYDKLQSNKIDTKLKKDKLLNKEYFSGCANEFELCPYELALEALEDADLIIGDYNHVFAIGASLRTYYENRKKKELCNLVIDEAHNLYSRMMDHYSPTLSHRELENFKKKELDCEKPIAQKFKRLIEKSIRLLKFYAPTPQKNQEIEVEFDTFNDLLLQAGSLLYEYYREKEKLEANDPVFGFYIYLSEFVNIFSTVAEETKILYRFTNSDEEITLLCCNPAKYIDPVLESFHSSTAFSATLKPFHFYRELSGFDEQCSFKEFPTSFPDENRKMVLIPQVSTTYRERDRYYDKIATAIQRISTLEKGHYVVYCPSFHYIDALMNKLEIDSENIYQQFPRMTPDELDDMSKRWSEPDTFSVTFAVQGGGLAEGIDVDSEHFKGVFIVGPALPQYNFERNILCQYYENKFKDGFNYAYIYPAMAKSIQAAGRVIRSEKKRGVIILLGRRFIQKEYSDTMPSYWYKKDIKELAISGILNNIKNFWELSK